MSLLKSSMLIVSAVTLVGGMLSSTPSFAWCRDYQDGWGRWHHECHPDGAVVAACSPADVDTNVQTADKVLAELSQNELSSAPVFKTKIAAIAALPSSQEKTDAYFHLAGITDTTDSTEVMNFIYARQVDQKYVQAVSQNLQLTSAQATLLINRLTAALKPRQ